MTATTQRGAAGRHCAVGSHTRAAHGHLAALLAAQKNVTAEVTRAAAGTVRAWMIDQSRGLLSVDVARAVVGQRPSAGDELAAAVAHLPAELFSGGLDVRGNYTVRLGEVNAYLGRDRDDREPTPDHGRAGPRLEVLVDRDPDYPTDVEAYVDGQRVRAEEYVLDPGAGYGWDDWVCSRAADIASASAPVAAELRQRVLATSVQFLDGAPDDPEQRARDLDAEVAFCRAEHSR